MTVTRRLSASKLVRAALTAREMAESSRGRIERYSRSTRITGRCGRWWRLPPVTRSGSLPAPRTVRASNARNTPRRYPGIDTRAQIAGAM
jgi:hypothetical protein